MSSILSGVRISRILLFSWQDDLTDQATKVVGLYNHVEPVIVTQLKYSHVPKAAQTWVDAFADDPIRRYIGETPDYKGDKSPYYNAIQNIIHRAMVALWIRTKIAKTVDQGASLITATYAENSHEGRHRSPSDRFFDFVATAFVQGLEKCQTPKQRERYEEDKRKSKAVVQNTIGDNVKDMMYVNGICTSPASQGRGYGGAVLDSVTAIADAQRRAIWLISSNINNTGFYNSHGFITVGTYVLGDKNSEWHDAPVLVSIMVRKPM